VCAPGVAAVAAAVLNQFDLPQSVIALLGCPKS
jgi:hypothetical protein